MVTDIMEKYGKFVSLTAPGYALEAYISRNNKRIRVIDYQGPDLEKLVKVLNDLGTEHTGITKIFAKVRKHDSHAFKNGGFLEEGVIKQYYNGEDAHVVSRFLSPSRRVVPPLIVDREQRIMEELKREEKETLREITDFPEGYRFIIAERRGDFEDLASLYKEVYLTYPFPIFETEYLQETARTHIIYGLVYNGNYELVAAASAETDPQNKNAEMTDFATRTSERGKGLALILLKRLEEEMARRGISSLYTIARSRSAGINKVFKRAGYEYSGKLINNCHINGDFENMSIWCKSNR